MTLVISFFVFSFVLALSGASWQDVEQLSFTVSLQAQSLSPDQENSFDIKLFQDEQESMLSEQIANGNFISDLTDWSYTGDLAVKNDTDGYYLQLGGPRSSTLITENCINQTINVSQSLSFLSFQHRLHSQEQLPGFDSVILLIAIDDRPVYLLPALDSGSWERETIRLPESVAGNHKLTVCGGNSGDRLVNSWVDLKQITTLATAVDDNDSLEMQTDLGNMLTVNYQQSGQEQQVQAEQVVLSLTEKIDDDLLYLQTSHTEGQLIEEELIVDYQSQLPQPLTNLQVRQAQENCYVLQFDHNDYLTSDYFDVRASKAVINETNFSQAQKINRTFLSHDWSLIRPVCLSEHCLLPICLEAGAVDNPQYLAIKACNPAANCSQLETINVSEPNQQQVVINEIMFNPDGSDNQDGYLGEWLELYNPGQTAIDLKNWQIIDAADNDILLTASNCDTNGQANDDGETTISAQGYLVVFAGYSLFNNSGDNLRLLDENQEIVDQVEYQATSNDFNTARVPDGSDNWQLNVPTTPLSANSSQ